MNSKNKKLGIFVCTRKRVSSLELLIETIFSYCSDKDNIDLWIGFDEDDHKTSSFLSLHQEKDRINTYINNAKSSSCIFCEADYVNRHKDIVQPMVDLSDAKYLWALNDDLTIRTNNFDLIIEKHIENFLSDKGDRVFYGMPLVHFINEKGIAKDTFSLDFDNKNIFKTDYSCYPIVTRETEKILGHFLNTKFASGGSDIILGAGIGLSNYCRKEDIPVVIEDKLIETFEHVRPWTVLPSEFIKDCGGIRMGIGEDYIPKKVVKAYVDVLKENNLSCEHYDIGGPNPQAEIIQTSHVLNENMQKNQIHDSIAPVGLELMLLFECPNCKTLYKISSAYRMDHTCCTNCGKTTYITPNRGVWNNILNFKNGLRSLLPEIRRGI